MNANEFDDKVATVLAALEVHETFADLEDPITFLKGPMRPVRVASRYGISITRAGISAWAVQQGGDDVGITMALTVTTITKGVPDEALLEELASEFAARVMTALSSIISHADWQWLLIRNSVTSDRTTQEQLFVTEAIECEMQWYTTT